MRWTLLERMVLKRTLAAAPLSLRTRTGVAPEDELFRSREASMSSQQPLPEWITAPAASSLFSMKVRWMRAAAPPAGPAPADTMYRVAPAPPVAVPPWSRAVLPDSWEQGTGNSTPKQ